MSLIVHANNVHTGGGKTLLISLLKCLEKNDILIVDSRIGDLSAINNEIKILYVKPYIIQRFKSEFYLKKIANKDDTILCFGNLPPLLKIDSKIFIYFQNRYLSSKNVHSEGHFLLRFRWFLERLWLRLFIRHCKLIVQSETMYHEVKKNLHFEPHILPFLPILSKKNNVKKTLLKKYDFLYVADGEPHKNHKKLIETWIFLSKQNIFPTLCLTLKDKKDEDLIIFIDMMKEKFGLKIFNFNLQQNDIFSLYNKCACLIYPSLFESFGLPLLEAKNYGLKIIAAEKDYVRDFIEPDLTFDPNSPLSISRAVKKILNINDVKNHPIKPSEFLYNLKKIK